MLATGRECKAARPRLYAQIRDERLYWWWCSDPRRGTDPRLSGSGVRAGKELDSAKVSILAFTCCWAKPRKKPSRTSHRFSKSMPSCWPSGLPAGPSDEQLAAIAQRGDWYSQGVPTVENYMKMGAWFAGTSEELIALIKGFEEMFPDSSTSTSPCRCVRRNP